MTGPILPAARSTLPQALRAQSRWDAIDGVIPVLLARPVAPTGPAPILIWLHGRTVSKELDPGRYLRLIRSGIGVAAIDLPGHGERYDQALQAPEATFDVVRQARAEIDRVVEWLRRPGDFDPDRVAVGGMSAGGMSVLSRLCSPHGFAAAAVEATTGSWRHQRGRAMFLHLAEDVIRALDPIEHLDTWREIPLQAIHARRDAWVDFAGQQAFIDALRNRARSPGSIELVVFEETGAPHEHAGFGRHAAEAKDLQRAFLIRHLRPR